MSPRGKPVDIIYTLGKSLRMNIGDKAPELLGIDKKGEEVYLSGYKGKKIVLYFYPRDSIPDRTAQACSPHDNYTELCEAGYKVIGVNINNEESRQKFIEKSNLPFTLIAGTDKELVKWFGIWGEKRLYDRVYVGTLHTTFLTNEEGIAEQVIDPKGVKTKEHASQIL